MSVEKTHFEAFYTNCHFMKARWEPVKIIGVASWGELLVEFRDGTRKLTGNLRKVGH